MLLDSSLTEQLPAYEYKKIHRDTIFIGCEIKNQYDEKRINLNELNDLALGRYIYKPTKYYNSHPVYLFGFVFEPKGKDKHLVNELKRLDGIDIITYTNILEKYNYTPDENYLKLTQNIYPLDIVHIQDYIPNFNSQQFFNFDSEIPMFQQLTSIKMYILPQ